MSSFCGTMLEYTECSIDRFDRHNLNSTAYFLSHCHADHMVGLDSDNLLYRLQNDYQIKIFCSEVTKNLLLQNPAYSRLQKHIVSLAVSCPQETVSHTLPVYDSTTRKEIYKIKVTLLQAGHCPGSVMFLFDGEQGKVLYTGDFRLNKNDIMAMTELNLSESASSLKSMYVDTTFCEPKAAFIPSREQSAFAAIGIAKEWISLSPDHHLMIAHKAGIGYEQLYKEMAVSLNTKIHVDARKFEAYKFVGDMTNYTTTNPNSTQIHACRWKNTSSSRRESPLPCGIQSSTGGKISVRTIKVSTMAFIHDVGLDDIAKRRSDHYYQVCYSFHSSYTEVRDIVTYLNPNRVFPNVIPLKETLQQIQERLNRFLDISANQKPLTSSQEHRPLGALKKRKKCKPIKGESSSDSDLDFGESTTPLKKKKSKVSKSPNARKKSISLEKDPSTDMHRCLQSHCEDGNGPTIDLTASDSETCSEQDFEGTNGNVMDLHEKKMSSADQVSLDNFTPIQDGSLGEFVSYCSDSDSDGLCCNKENENLPRQKITEKRSCTIISENRCIDVTEISNGSQSLNLFLDGASDDSETKNEDPKGGGDATKNKTDKAENKTMQKKSLGNDVNVDSSDEKKCAQKSLKGDDQDEFDQTVLEGDHEIIDESLEDELLAEPDEKSTGNLEAVGPSISSQDEDAKLKVEFDEYDVYKTEEEILEEELLKTPEKGDVVNTPETSPLEDAGDLLSNDQKEEAKEENTSNNISLDKDNDGDSIECEEPKTTMNTVVNLDTQPSVEILESMPSTKRKRKDSDVSEIVDDENITLPSKKSKDGDEIGESDSIPGTSKECSSPIKENESDNSGNDIILLDSDDNSCPTQDSGPTVDYNYLTKQQYMVQVMMAKKHKEQQYVAMKPHKEGGTIDLTEDMSDSEDEHNGSDIHEIDSNGFDSEIEAEMHDYDSDSSGVSVDENEWYVAYDQLRKLRRADKRAGRSPPPSSDKIIVLDSSDDEEMKDNEKDIAQGIKSNDSEDDEHSSKESALEKESAMDISDISNTEHKESALEKDTKSKDCEDEEHASNTEHKESGLEKESAMDKSDILSSETEKEEAGQTNLQIHGKDSATDKKSGDNVEELQNSDICKSDADQSCASPNVSPCVDNAEISSPKSESEISNVAKDKTSLLDSICDDISLQAEQSLDEDKNMEMCKSIKSVSKELSIAETKNDIDTAMKDCADVKESENLVDDSAVEKVEEINGTV